MVAGTVGSTNLESRGSGERVRYAFSARRASLRAPEAGERSGARSGLTLIELLIVIVIVGILVTISIPRISNIRQGMAVDAAANQVLGDLRRARSEALKRNKSIKMGKTSSTTYTIDSIGSRTLPNSAEFTAGSDSIRFSSFGPPTTGAASFTISLNGKTKRVVLSAAGLMTVE